MLKEDGKKYSALILQAYETYASLIDNTLEKCFSFDSANIMDTIQHLQQDATKTFHDYVCQGTLVGYLMRNTYDIVVDKRYDTVVILFKTEQSDYTNAKRLKPYETFCYNASLGVEGCHIRNAEIARGGIRLHSSKTENYRNICIDLSSVQTLKNALSATAGGAKGAFIKHDIYMDSVLAYRVFISALLTSTQMLPNRYLLIAADVGTGDFTDLAHDLAIEQQYEYHHSFCSGTSKGGYQHKEIGITSLGALEVLYSYMHTSDSNTCTTVLPKTVVSIGNMTGDVFSNFFKKASIGLVIKAAFDSEHIYLNLNPTVEDTEMLIGFAKPWGRLDLALSADYMIIARESQEVLLPHSYAQWLDLPLITSGNSIVKAILQVKADILFSGGIGCYITSADAITTAYQITPQNLKVACIIEGGNLAVSESARHNIPVNVLHHGDFIVNSAAVRLSDLEVNYRHVCSANLMHDIKKDMISSCILDLKKDLSHIHSIRFYKSPQHIQYVLHCMEEMLDKSTYEQKWISHVMLSYNGPESFYNASLIVSYITMLLKEIYKQKYSIYTQYQEKHVLQAYYKHIKQFKDVDVDIIQSNIRQSIVSFYLAKNATYQLIRHLPNISTKKQVHDVIFSNILETSFDSATNQV